MQGMEPIYQKLKESSQFQTDDGKKHRKGAFGHEWLWGGAPNDLTLRDFSDTMMRTMIAAIHTTAKTISIALIDLLTQRDLFEELKKEARIE
jgi:hypothetical protein